MAADKSRPKLLVIVGPTASGKSELAQRIATEFGGEIICADSRTIYKGMDIGTAKPGVDDRKAVRHWGLDLVEPGQRYSAADFKKYANAAITDIQSRGKLPVLVGGSGLYVDSVLFDYQFSESGAERDAKNPRHLKKSGQKKDQKVRTDALLIGLQIPKEELRKRINQRAEDMFTKGITNESRELFQKYGSEKFEGTAGIVYRIIARQMKGEISQDEAIELFKKADWQYARRQRTWFRKNRYINWFNSSQAAEKWLKKQLLNT